MKLTLYNDSNSPSYQFSYHFGRCVGVSDTVFPKGLEKACQGYSGHQTRTEKQVDFYSLF